LNSVLVLIRTLYINHLLGECCDRGCCFNTLNLETVVLNGDSMENELARATSRRVRDSCDCLIFVDDTESILMVITELGNHRVRKLKSKLKNGDEHTWNVIDSVTNGIQKPVIPFYVYIPKNRYNLTLATFRNERLRINGRKYRIHIRKCGDNLADFIVQDNIQRNDCFPEE